MNLSNEICHFCNNIKQLFEKYKDVKLIFKTWKCLTSQWHQLTVTLFCWCLGQGSKGSFPHVLYTIWEMIHATKGQSYSLNVKNFASKLFRDAADLLDFVFSSLLIRELQNVISQPFVNQFSKFKLPLILHLYGNIIYFYSYVMACTSNFSGHFFKFQTSKCPILAICQPIFKI